MTEKILYFASFPTDLQLSKYLQEHGFDLFSIIDVPDLLKKTFEEQDVISFTKVWFYRDYVKKNLEKIDMSYLIDFEEKYGINLWSIIYKDRNLYGYNDYHIFNQEEILKISEKTIKFYELVLDEVKPSFVYIHTPDLFHIELLYEICKAKKIKILTTSYSRFPHRWIISEKTDELDYQESIFNDNFIDNPKSFDELRSLLIGLLESQSPQEYDVLISQKTKLKGFFHYMFSVCNDEYRTFHTNFGRTRFRILINESSKFITRFFRIKFIEKNLKKQINLDLPFAYLTLHTDPERSTLSAAPNFTNQLEVIRNIAISLPIDYKLYVKEHPIQIINNWRKISFYKEILKIPNVELLHPTFSNDELLKKCSLVIVVAGTAGFLAAFYEKPSIVFSDVLYSSLPSVHTVKNLKDLPSLIRTAINTKVNNSDLNKYVNTILKNSFVLNIHSMFNGMVKEFFYDGFTSDVYIPKLKLEQSLHEKKDLLDKWGSEILKKINEHKNHN